LLAPPAAIPLYSTRRFVMYKHVLIPTDGSELSSKAEAAGMTLARALDAKVTALTVTPPFQFIGTEPMMLTATEPEYEKAQAARFEVDHVDQPDKVDPFVLETIPAFTLGALAIAL
jgi:nucleotide-binding universal stress UspA family protein